MINNHKLVLDTFCEVYDLLLPWADGEFYNLQEHIRDGLLVEGAIYLISRQQFRTNIETIRKLTDKVHVVLSNPAEGSDTLRTHCNSVYNVGDLVQSNKILLIGGGDMDNSWPCLQYDSFLPKTLNYKENLIAASKIDEIYNKTNKPYKFLFLNGRTRPHRKYLLESFALSGLLDQSLWTCLDSQNSGNKNIRLIHNGQDLMYSVRPVKLLPQEYEFDFYQDRINLPVEQNQGSFIKNHLFNNEWGEIYIKPEQYIDTYFSLVTETVFEYPYSFRTEKIWKPITMGHPFIVVANQGYYRDLHNLGYKTFGHVIDESFDQIENNQKRLEKINQLVEDLCRQNLADFLKECYNTCKYNQQHHAEMSQKVRKEFPNRFTEFIKKFVS